MSFDVAVEHFRDGRRREAEAVCQAILSKNPHHPQSHYLLGILAQQAGRHDVAVEHLRQATFGQPRQAAHLVSLGESLQALGRVAEAQRSYRDAIELDPGYIAAHYRLGQLHQAQGDLPGAAASFRALLQHAPNHAETHNDLALVLRASGDEASAERHLRQAILLRPDFVQAHINLGNLLQDRGEMNAAIAALQHAANLRPDLAAAQFNLANALRTAGHRERAATHYRRAIQLEPTLAAAHNNLGTLLHALRDSAGAIAALGEAIRLNPGFADAHLNLALVLQQQGDWTAARDQYRRAVALRPDLASAHYNLGTVLQALRDWAGADASYREALRLKPDDAVPRVNLGINCQAVGQYAAAREWYDAALAIDPSSAEAHCNRGMLLLSQGEWNAGWADYWWIAQCKPGRPVGSQPAWDGSRLSGRRVLVRCNQGVGDMLQFLRYLPCIWRRGAGAVHVAAPLPLHPLLASSGVGNLVSPEALPDFDLQVSIMLLPALFFGEARWMTEQVPYVRADETLVGQWREQLSAIGGLRVGICWQGNPKYARDPWRSAPLRELVPLAGVRGVRLISLQRGYGSEQLAELSQASGIVELAAEFDGSQGAFMDTAAVLANLDLIVTTDTAMAHLAGAMGRPAWVALSHAPEWRWQQQGETSPWYPSLRLFRQTAPGDWGGVFARMAEQLSALAAQGTAP